MSPIDLPIDGPGDCRSLVHRRRRWSTAAVGAVVGAATLAVPACLVDNTQTDTRSPLGLDDAATDDIKPEHQPAFVEPTLEEVQRRGVELHRLERLWGLAHEVGLPRAGAVRAEVLLPLASIDDGGRSGEVVFYRWMEAPEGEPDPLEATRWLVVPALFEPDRVLENEQFSDPVEVDSDAHRRLEAFLLAVGASHRQHPQGSWRIYTFREFVERGTRRIGQTRVYMLGNGDAPDLELVVTDRSRREPAAIVSSDVLQTAGQRDAVTMTLPGSSVHPVAVCRAMARDGDVVEVVGDGGARWRVVTADGRIEVVPAKAENPQTPPRSEP